MPRHQFPRFSLLALLIVFVATGFFLLPGIVGTEPFQEWLYRIDLYADDYPTPTGSIYGQLHDTDGYPLRGVEVQLVGMGAIYKTTTEQTEGWYRFDVPIGTYVVSPVKAFFEPASETRTIEINTSASAHFYRKNVTPTWTLMYYFATDNDLEYGSLLRTTPELVQASLNPYVNVVAFVDGKEDPPRYIHYREGRPLDVTMLQYEPNTGNAQTLRDFIDFARGNYPASRYVLTIADHGHGISGVAVDTTDTPGNEDWLTIAELKSALDGGPHLDILFMNTCLMATIDAALELSAYADYYVASEAVIWLYDRYFYIAGEDIFQPILPHTTARDLALNIASSYYRVLRTDPKPLSDHPGTISVMNLAQARTTAQSASDLAAAIRQNMAQNLGTMYATYNDVQRFNERIVFPDRLADLYDFADKMGSRSPTPEVRDAAQNLKSAIGQFVISHLFWNGYVDSANWDFNNSHGVSVVFPGVTHLLCYYNAEWLQFAGNAYWNCRGQAAAVAADDNLEAFEWGSMLADYVRASNANPEEKWDAPAPVPPLLVTFDAYLPYISYVPAPTPTPNPDSAEEILIPTGAFQMGCDSNNAWEDCNADERPLHTIYLDAYYIDKYEVTNTRFQRCVSAGGCTAPHNRSSATRASYYDNPAYAEYPVIYVDWNQANAFCAWAGKRLPSEAEWEKAARGSGDTRKYPWGNSTPNCAQANYYLRGAGFCVGDTDRVGAAIAGASAYGVHDMAGNVWEWVNDRYGSDYYSMSPASNPQGPATGSGWVQRGGAWHFGDEGVRSADRASDVPWFSGYSGGFRCAH